MLYNPNLLDIIDGNSLRFTVRAYTLGEANVRPRYTASIIKAQVLRVFPAWSSPGLSDEYFDLLSTRLIARLTAWLQSGDYTRRIFTLTKHGDGPASEWQLSVETAT